MTRAELLLVIVEKIERWQEAGVEADKIIVRLDRSNGARLRFSAGTNELRIAAVAGTCTSGGDALLNAWLRAARRRMDKDRIADSFDRRAR